VSALFGKKVIDIKRKYYITVPVKPKSCAHCPLKTGETRECGKMKAEHTSNASVYYDKVPDRRCRIKEKL
jgi:hypothetical protein